MSLTHGIALHNGYLYASSAIRVYRWPYKPGQFSLINQNTRQTVVTNITQTSSGHSTRTLTFDNEGRLYISVGSYANIDADSYRSRIRRFNLELQFLPIPFNNGKFGSFFAVNYCSISPQSRVLYSSRKNYFEFNEINICLRESR